MGSTPGAFGSPTGGHIQCTAKSRRSGVQCRGIAVSGSPNKKCRMHGGNAQHAIGAANPQFKHGRHSKYLPSQLDTLYREALANPDLLELADHIALLEARIQSILAENAAGDPVPRWSDFRTQFDRLATAVLTGDPEAINAELASIFATLDAGAKWDSTWEQVTGTLEQLRKLTDTEVKRKKELNQMVPIERVVILMAAVANAVKRHVSNPSEIQAVYRELAMLHGTDKVHDKKVERVGPEVIDVTPRPKRVKRMRTLRPLEEIQT